VNVFIKNIVIYCSIEYACRMAGLQKGEKRPWVAGKPKFTNGELRRVTLLLSDRQVQFLHQQGNVSATVRRLIDKEMVHAQKREQNKSEKPVLEKHSTASKK
jgi:hypothetical protein